MPQQLLAGVAEGLTKGSVGVEDVAAGVFEQDAVRAEFEKRVVECLLPGQGRFRLLTFRNVQGKQRHPGHVVHRVEDGAFEVHKMPARARVLIVSRFPRADDLVEHRFPGFGKRGRDEAESVLAHQFALGSAQAVGQRPVADQDHAIPVQQESRLRQRVEEDAQRFLTLPQRFFRPLPFGDVLPDDHQIETTADAHAAAPGLDLDQAAVLSSRDVFFRGGALRPDLFQARFEPFAVGLGWMTRHCQHGLARQFAALVTQQGVQGGVGQNDGAMIVNHQDGFRHVLQNARLHLELFLCMEALGHILLHHNHQLPALDFQPADCRLAKDKHAVFASVPERSAP